MRPQVSDRRETPRDGIYNTAGHTPQQAEYYACRKSCLISINYDRTAVKKG